MRKRISVNLVVFSLGFVAFSAGIGAIYWPAALVLGGLVLMAISLFGDAKK